MRHAIGYVRISKAERGNEQIGPQVQREAITRYCEARGYKLTEIIEDIGVSGGKSIRDRDGGRRLLEALAEKKQLLVALKQDRLFRSNRDALNTMHDLRQIGIPTALVSESLDLTTPSGRLSFAILAAVAEWERETIGERTKAAMDHKRSRGERISRHAPYGFRFVPTERQGKDGKPILVLETHPGEQAAIDQMRQLQRDGYAYRRIAQWLNAKGIEPRHGRRWQHSSVRKILAQDTARRKQAEQSAPNASNQER